MTRPENQSRQRSGNDTDQLDGARSTQIASETVNPTAAACRFGRDYSLSGQARTMPKSPHQAQMHCSQETGRV